MWLHRILTQIQVIVRRITKTYVSGAFVGQLNTENSGEEGSTQCCLSKIKMQKFARTRSTVWTNVPARYFVEGGS